MAKAEAAAQEVEAAEPAARTKILEKRAKIWGELKPWLLDLSGQKCWFSEANDCFQHWDVEHFRPKGRAKDLEGVEREGYWWLSFDWRNLRVCGRVGNTKKGAFFPLASSYVADSDHRDIADEIPLLLDPANMADCMLLSFNQLGEAIPAAGADELSDQRVRVSVERYDLDYDPLVTRRLEIWKTCTAWLYEIQNLLNDQTKSASAARQAIIEAKTRQLADLCRPESECSSAAVACLQKSEVGWAVRLSAEAASARQSTNPGGKTGSASKPEAKDG